MPLFQTEQPLRLGDLAEGAAVVEAGDDRVGRSSVKQAGLVERERDPTDGRAYIVRLSERGRSFRDVAEGVLDDLDEQLHALLGTPTTEALINALKGVMEL